MRVSKCDICGKEIGSFPDKLVFTNIKKRYWVFTTLKEEVLDVCGECQRDLRKALDRVKEDQNNGKS